MSKENNGGPAFPTDNEKQTGPNTWHHSGMSLRDYFAAKAMQTLLSHEISKPPGITAEALVAAGAYVIADAMLEAREK